MCGFTGFLSPGNFSADASFLAERMANAIKHRGPDDAGTWTDSAAGIALAHRRLSILDTSTAGHQPMVSACERYVIAFNGEIYNHLELRSALEASGLAPGWRGHSDTETLLAAIAAWGMKATLERCVGMFAFALWNRGEQKLTLVRDRMGEKPLYFGLHGGTLLFGSELKAIRRHPAFLGEIDREALTLYLRYNCIPAPYSIYQGINKLMPGTYLEIGPGLELGEPVTYWSVGQVAESGMNNAYAGSDQDAARELELLLSRSVGGQMVADVPLGAFLSGGVDSSTIVALMQAQSSRPIKTFTIGFSEQGYNEAEHARAVARHLGTEHTEIFVTPEQAMAVIPRLPQIYDEPFSDSSQIPTFLVSQLAREHVTVSLSGDGGDELFGGYNRYSVGHGAWNRMRRLPSPLRSLIASSIEAVPPGQWDVLMGRLSPILPEKLRFGTPGDKLHKLAGVLGADSADALYRRLVSHWSDPASVVLHGKEPNLFSSRSSSALESENKMMLLDMQGYLPNDILTKVDRAAMSVSLETRVPLLDHRLVEFAWRLPLHMKIRDGQGKYLLRQVLYKHVPRELIERPKMGFGIPLDAWLRGPLRDWAEELLNPGKLVQDGFFDPAQVRQKWEEHLSSRRNWAYHIWDILMFQAWLGQVSHEKA